MNLENGRKTIGINIPCYNEEENVVPICEAIIKLFDGELAGYNYLIQFIDNNSEDTTQEKIRDLCKKYMCVRAIFNEKNYRWYSSSYGLWQAEGDCIIAIAADFEEPVELIREFVKYWEEGYGLILGVKKSSNEKKRMFFMRKLYYHILESVSDIEIIDGFSGFGLYDRKFIEIYKNSCDYATVFRTFVSENGYRIKTIEYEKKERLHGKSKHSFLSLCDDFLVTFVSCSTVGIRLVTMSGMGLSIVSIMVALIYLILKILKWNSFNAGIAPILIGMFFLGGVQLFIMGLLGEYILKIDKRLLKQPFVVERERINFNDEWKKGDKELMDRGRKK